MFGNIWFVISFQPTFSPRWSPENSSGDSRMSPSISNLFVYYSACVIIIPFSLVRPQGTDQERGSSADYTQTLRNNPKKKHGWFPDCERWSVRNDGLLRENNSNNHLRTVQSLLSNPISSLGACIYYWQEAVMLSIWCGQSLHTHRMRQ